MASKTIGLVIAMTEERKHLLRGRTVEKGRNGTFPFFTVAGAQRRLVVVETGMGSARASAGAKALIDAGPPDLLVSIGFGGGLTDGLLPGEIVIADRLLRYQEGRFDQRSRALLSDVDLVRLPSHRVGTFITTDGVEEKDSLLEKLPKPVRNCVIDMETWGVAEVAAREKIPLLAIRVISDGAGEEVTLPLEAVTTSGGQVSLFRILLQVAKKPSLIPQLLRLGKNAATAGRNLTKVVEALMDGEKASRHP